MASCKGHKNLDDHLQSRLNGFQGSAFSVCRLKNLIMPFLFSEKKVSAFCSVPVMEFSETEIQALESERSSAGVKLEARRALFFFSMCVERVAVVIYMQTKFCS